jgi:hypothetical protein
MNDKPAPAAPPAPKAEEMRGRNLQNMDLSAVEGLLPEHLARADLTGAKLREEITNFPALEQTKAIFGEARTVFIGLLLACACSWVAISMTTDVALILNATSWPLPMIGEPVPIASFYVIAATILAALYWYLHIRLQSLWRTLATLPAVFPDGTRLDDKTDLGIAAGLVRAYVPHLSRAPGHLQDLGI